MAAALGERVVLGRPVRRIEHDDSGVRVIARDGSQYHGDAAAWRLGAAPRCPRAGPGPTR